MKEQPLNKEILDCIEKAAEAAAEAATANFDREKYEEAVKKSKRLSKQKERNNK